MDPVLRAAQEEAVRAAEAEIKNNILFAWIFLIGAALLVAFCAGSYAVHFAVHHTAGRAPDTALWTQLVIECPLILFMLGVSFAAWRYANGRQELLRQLAEEMAREATPEQPGVWPPPPTAME